MFEAYKDTDGFKALEADADGLIWLGKFKNDTELKDEEKVKFLEYLGKFDPFAGLSIKGYCNLFFWRDDLESKLLGSTCTFNCDKWIRIRGKVDFVDWSIKLAGRDIEATIEKLLDTSAPDWKKRYQFKIYQETRLREDLVNNPVECEIYTGMVSLPSSVRPVVGEAKSSQFIEWSSPDLATDDLLSSPHLELLDCRSGLSENRNDDKVVYRHSPIECKRVCRPTVFDAEFYPQFNLGGKTVPLDECKGQDGFDEYVHEAIRMKKIIPLPVQIVK